jgi:hypothetical protein
MVGSPPLFRTLANYRCLRLEGIGAGFLRALALPLLTLIHLSLRFNQEGFCDGHKAHRKTPRVRPLHPLRQPF